VKSTVTRNDGSGPVTETKLFLNDTQSPYGFTRVLEERTEGGVILASFVHGPEPISQTRPEGTSYYLSDAHSGVRHLADANENLTDGYLYDAFGNIINSSGATVNPLLYRGEQWDDAIGQYYLRARYYDPATARFHRLDPLSGIPSNPVTLHKYLYAGADPIQMIDPSGESLLTASMAGMGMQAAAQAAKMKADMEQGERIKGSRFGYGVNS